MTDFQFVEIGNDIWIMAINSNDEAEVVFPATYNDKNVTTINLNVVNTSVDITSLKTTNPNLVAFSFGTGEVFNDNSTITTLEITATNCDINAAGYNFRYLINNWSALTTVNLDGCHGNKIINGAPALTTMSLTNYNGKFDGGSDGNGAFKNTGIGHLIISETCTPSSYMFQDNTEIQVVEYMPGRTTACLTPGLFKGCTKLSNILWHENKPLGESNIIPREVCMNCSALDLTKGVGFKIQTLIESLDSTVSYLNVGACAFKGCAIVGIDLRSDNTNIRWFEFEDECFNGLGYNGQGGIVFFPLLTSALISNAQYGVNVFTPGSSLVVQSDNISAFQSTSNLSQYFIRSDTNLKVIYTPYYYTGTEWISMVNKEYVPEEPEEPETPSGGGVYMHCISFILQNATSANPQFPGGVHTMIPSTSSTPITTLTEFQELYKDARFWQPPVWGVSVINDELRIPTGISTIDTSANTIKIYFDRGTTTGNRIASNYTISFNTGTFNYTIKDTVIGA